MTYAHRLSRTAVAVFGLTLALLAFTAAAAFAQQQLNGGGSPPPDAAQPSRPSPETGKRGEPQLFLFILAGGGIISAIGVVFADRTVRAQHRPRVAVRPAR